ncbi:hypothetical protein R1flu_014089 [Riccia fluitans]|uniref:Uncharacterized protein n=1 Tax=Riccia fluitans TaxID=41844 RepID=A0ABD1YF41_9MARC
MRIRGSTISKVRAFDIMALALSGMNGFPQVTGEEMKKHFVRYEKMYKDTRRWKDSTNAGLTDAEIQKGSGKLDTEEEVQVTRITTKVEENFVAKDHAKETFINLMDAKYGEDETSGDEEGEHFEHASGGGSEVNELV